MKPSHKILLERSARFFSTAALVLGACLHQQEAVAGSFATDASSVSMGKIEPSYCSSIDGVDYSLKDYFSNADQVSSITGLIVKERTANGVCCTGAKLLTGGVCVDPVPTVESCAAQGLVLVAGKCVVYVPDPCPTTEDWFAGRFINYGEIQNTNWFINSQQLSLGVRTTGTGSVRQHIFERGYFNGGFAQMWESVFNFNVTNPSDVGGFALISTVVDDHMLITVNGRAIAALPAGIWMSSPAPWNFPFGATGLELQPGGAVYEGYAGGQGGVRLLRPGESDALFAASWGFPSSVDEMTHPFIGVPTYERRAYAPYMQFVYGGYLCYDTGYCYRKFPPIDTMGGWGEGHYIDIRPYLVAGLNKIRIVKAANKNTYTQLTIQATAKSGASCN